MNNKPTLTTFWHKKDEVFRVVIIIVLAVAVVVEMIVLMRDIGTTKEHGGLKPRIRHEQTMAVEPWMTFTYLNTLFSLPDPYLAERLSIADARYPDLEIRRYAKEYGIDPLVLVRAIKNAIQQHRGV